MTTAFSGDPASQPTRQRVFAFALMCVGFFMATLDIQIVASSLRDLGGGLSAIFQLENGFYTNNGQFATANTIWNRAAFVGLSSERYGTLTLGRQTPLTFDYLDPLSTAYLAMSWFAFHPGNIDGLAA
ncbi:porin, partial [Bacillus licheniformis]|nr:porin [Bacillus licheniformis]